MPQGTLEANLKKIYGWNLSRNPWKKQKRNANKAAGKIPIKVQGRTSATGRVLKETA